MAKKKKKTKVEVVKEATIYRGKPIEELKALDVRESAKFIPSRSRRSILRNFQKIENFLKRCEKKLSKNKKIATHDREMVIVPKFIGMTIGVYNGKTFNQVLVTPEMIGHRLGEFSPTRTRVNHGSAGIGATKSSRAQKK